MPGHRTDQLGFAKNWHVGDGAGGVCQVSRSDCEIILCEDGQRRDKARLLIGLTAASASHLKDAGVAKLRHVLAPGTGCRKTTA